jgi:hypothetical protein
LKCEARENEAKDALHEASLASQKLETMLSQMCAENTRLKHPKGSVEATEVALVRADFQKLLEAYQMVAAALGPDRAASAIQRYDDDASFLLR